MLIPAIIERIISTFFVTGLFINASLFVPQALRILRTKNVEGLSATTFIGFCIMQISSILYGIIKEDFNLIIGYGLSLLTCGIVTILILRYKHQR